MDKRLTYLGVVIVGLLVAGYWFINSPTIKVELLNASIQPEDMTSTVLITKRLYLEAVNNAESVRDLLGEESDEYKQTLANLEEAKEHLDTLIGLYHYKVELNLEIQNSGKTPITLKKPKGELTLEGAEFKMDEREKIQGIFPGETNTFVITFTSIDSEKSKELYWKDSLTGEYSGSIQASAKISKKTVQYGGSVTLLHE
jgi:hypothetical protein